MLLEDQRFIHEDLERLEQGISDRILIEPRTVSSLIGILLALLSMSLVADLVSNHRLESG